LTTTVYKSCYLLTHFLKYYFHFIIYCIHYRLNKYIFCFIDETEVKNPVICNIAGKIWRSTYVFDINQLPERCDIFLIGEYAFDAKNGTDTQVMESDRGNYIQLKYTNM